MNSPLEETIVGDLFRTSLIGTGFVSAVCARTIVGHAKAQTMASIIALFIVSILVHNLDARWSSVIRVPSKGTGNYPSKQTLPSIGNGEVEQFNPVCSTIHSTAGVSAPG